MRAKMSLYDEKQLEENTFSPETGNTELEVKKGKKKKEKNPDNVYTPMAMTKALSAMGETYTKSQIIITYLLIFALGIGIGVLFALPWKLLVLVGVTYIIMTPKLLYNYKKRLYEKKRFDDANSYLSQMAQSFTSTKNIYRSLMETEDTFVEGKMKRVIRKAIEKIEEPNEDMRKAEAEALEMIAKSYDCEKVRNLHDFLLRASERGGDCVAEFRILEKIRFAWAKAVENYHATLISSRNTVAFAFVALMAVMAVFLQKFPERIDLISVPMVQLTNAVEIILFLVVFIFMDNKLNVSLLRDAEMMPEAVVQRNHDYIANFDNKKALVKNIPIIAIAVVLAIGLVYLTKKPLAAVIGVAVIVLAINLHKLNLRLTIENMKSEMQRAFPKWLFDVMLLMQTESVEVSIFTSYDSAPPVLKPELKRVCDALIDKPGNPDAYMSFLAPYQIRGVEDTMRKLYSLSVGTGDKGIMEVIIDSNMTILFEAEEKNMVFKGGMSSIYSYIPVFCVAGGLVIYFIMLMVSVFGMLAEMMQGVGL